MKSIIACGKKYRIIKLLGHGKGGYSYLAETEAGQVVVKQIHHEPCDERLGKAGIRIPAMIAIDDEKEIVVKEYIAGDTIFDLVKEGHSAEPYLDQVREMAAQAQSAGLNIDYFPTNFVIRDGRIWYVDYECNDYMEKWNFENWGIRYWSRTPEFREYLRQHNEKTNGEEE